MLTQKSVESSCCPFRTLRLLYCLSKSNRQRQSPRRYEYCSPKETYIIMWLGPSREQSMLTRSPQGWYNHTRDIHRWLYSRLWYCGLQDFSVPQTQCRVNAFNMSWTIFPPKPALHWCLATYHTLRGVGFTNAFMRTCPFIAFLKKL